MNEPSVIIASIVIGIVCGLLYGFFYVLSKKKFFSTLHTTPSKKDLLSLSASSILRILLFGALVYLLLLSPSIHFILTIACFIASFWAFIVYKEVR